MNELKLLNTASSLPHPLLCHSLPRPAPPPPAFLNSTDFPSYELCTCISFALESTSARPSVDRPTLFVKQLFSFFSEVL